MQVDHPLCGAHLLIHVIAPEAAVQRGVHRGELGSRGGGLVGRQAVDVGQLRSDGGGGGRVGAAGAAGRGCYVRGERLRSERWRLERLNGRLKGSGVCVVRVRAQGPCAGSARIKRPCGVGH